MRHRQDIELINISRGPDRYPDPVGYSYLDLDLLDHFKVQQFITDYRPDCIIHTAAMTNVDACEDQPEACKQLNVDVVANLCALCEKWNIHFIHLSTDFIFDGLNGPYQEEDKPNPLSTYGQSKMESEHVVSASDCPWTIIRTIIVYGVVADMSRTNIVLWAKSALEKGEPLNVVNDQWRMPTLAEDLATACIASAMKGQTGVYHVSGAEHFSIKELVEEVADFWKLDASLIRSISSSTLSQKAPRPARTGFILDKARRDLDYQPTPFRKGLALVELQLHGKSLG